MFLNESFALFPGRLSQRDNEALLVHILPVRAGAHTVADHTLPNTHNTDIDKEAGTLHFTLIHTPQSGKPGLWMQICMDPLSNSLSLIHIRNADPDPRGKIQEND